MNVNPIKRKFVVSFEEDQDGNGLDFLDLLLNNFVEKSDTICGIHSNNINNIELKEAFCKKCSENGNSHEWKTIEDCIATKVQHQVWIGRHSQIKNLTHYASSGLSLNNWVIVSEHIEVPIELVFVYEGTEESKNAIRSFIESFSDNFASQQSKLFIYYPNLKSTSTNAEEEIILVKFIRTKFPDTEIHKVIGSSPEVMLYSSNFKRTSLFVMGKKAESVEMSSFLDNPIERILLKEHIPFIILLKG